MLEKAFNTNFSSPLIKSEIALCPQCSCKCSITSDRYNIRSICKNGHKLNLPSYIFEQAQYRAINKIKCDTCENSFNETEFFYCFTCNKNICPYCKNHHFSIDLENNINIHNIVLYNQKDYYCVDHFEKFISYCFDCKKNLCFQCESIHKEHKTIEYDLNLRKKKEQIETTNKLMDNLSYIKNDFINKFQSFYDVIFTTYQIFCEKNLNFGNIRAWESLRNQQAYDMIYFIQDLQNIINNYKKENDILKFLKLFESLYFLYEKVSNPNYKMNLPKINHNISTNKEIELKKIEKNTIEDTKNIYIKNDKLIKFNGFKYNNLSIYTKNRFNNSFINVNYFIDYVSYYKSALNIRNIITKNVINISYNFETCISLKYKIGTNNYNIKIQNDTSLNNIFSNCITFQEYINQQKFNLIHDKNNNCLEYIDNDNESELIEWNSNELTKIQDKDINGNLNSYIKYLDLINGYQIDSEKLSDFYFCKKDMGSKLSSFDNCSSINPKIKTLSESSLDDSSGEDIYSKAYDSLKHHEPIIIKLVQNNNEKEINLKNKIITKKSRNKNMKKNNKIIYYKEIKYSFANNSLDYINIIKIYSSTYFENIENKILYLLSIIEYISGLDSKYKLNEVFLSLLNDNKGLKCNYSRVCLFSSLFEEKIVYISFLTKGIIISYLKKGGIMTGVKYPYGYLLSNILFK